ncbi:hypothetical protein A5780_30565 [Nocardia sp. 852002-20019_SCH5090214]|uniref:hypothetical protein n=1 Tax=Nocardia TaxID=1817 RepID=UPI0007C70D41|nr:MULTISPECIES: hypothetical protein [Nocardia]MCC3316747.1 hypothetical protein [Nocardia africana]OBA50946.1 hypothetical protein A5780_30565 [Nocardia sp. 852002-20019_SCH5090214]
MTGNKTPRPNLNRATSKALGGKRNDRGTLLLWIGAVAVVVALIVAIAVTVVRGADNKKHENAAVGLNNPAAATATGAASAPPWAAPTDATGAVRRAGLPMLAEEGAVEHIHIHLDVLVDGKPVAVPANIGVDRSTGKMSPLHSHDNSGVVHIESPVQRKYSLGELFSEWSVSLSEGNIGALRAADGQALHAYVDGQLRQGNPAAITFNEHDEVALVYGPADSKTTPPSSYSFGNGE